MKNIFVNGLVILVCISLISLCIFPGENSAHASNEVLTENDVEKVNLNKVENLDIVLKKVGQDKSTILPNSYNLKGKNIGFINIKGNDGKYYNFYLEKNYITYYSVQYKKGNGNAVFELRDNNKNFVLSSEVNKDGKIVSEKTIDDLKSNYRSANVNKAALKWACIFSSYAACVGVAASVGAAGSLVSGPFGAAAGFAGGLACRVVFQTAVEKYGGKKAACKYLTR
ncbi:hypothetical protein NQ043_00010 [Staphylococcus hyicus]|uniref:hypothetical protein n=1 Tax=Staphylococcus hyicus TaxID=1284 RepID=UPI00211CCCB0|nr:hypothetical protein [Staphylococcus hyicus]MCQ9299530.1 hypothetical protein [Staphylococcus hyicus]